MVTQQGGDPEMLWTEVLKIKKCHHPKHPVKEWLKIITLHPGNRTTA